MAHKFLLNPGEKQPNCQSCNVWERLITQGKESTNLGHTQEMACLGVTTGRRVSKEGRKLIDPLPNHVLYVVYLLGVLPYFRIPSAAAAGGAIAQEFLSSPSAVHLADVHISFGIDSHHVRPMEFACLAPAPSEAAQFCEVLPVDYVDGVIEEIGDVHAALLRVGREVHGTRRAANGLRSNVDLAHKSTFADLAIRI